jgi:hypothetical protein
VVTDTAAPSGYHARFKFPEVGFAYPGIDLRYKVKQLTGREAKRPFPTDDTKSARTRIIPMALGLLAARRKFPADRDFGDWLCHTTSGGKADQKGYVPEN